MISARLQETKETARALKIELDVLTASDTNGLDQTLHVIARGRPAGLFVFDDPVFFLHRQRIIDFATQHRVPTVYSQSGWAGRAA